MYHPTRLAVLGRCRWYRGIVVFSRSEADGDVHVDIAPAPGYLRFLVHDNLIDQYGTLVVEIMPGQRLPVPRAGEHVAVLGTWVRDTQHGWNELHPVWAIRYETGRLIRSLPPATARYNPGGSGSSGSSGGITAICNDGSYSYSQHASGTCSYHGGVRQWIHHPPS